MAYFSNSTAGDVLDNQCSACPVPDDASCPVLLVQMEYNYKQLKTGQETLRKAINSLIDEKGQCKMKQAIEHDSPPEPVAPMESMKQWAKDRGVAIK